MYLDHASTTPIRPCAKEAMLRWLDQDHWGNPSSLHENGRQAREAIEDSRDLIASLIHCRARDLIFTSGATESNTLALRGAVMAWENKKTLLVSNLEHPSVMENAQQLSREGQQVLWIAPDAQGAITADLFASHLNEHSGLAVAMLANNEVGHLTDVKSITQVCRRFGTQFHCDGTQAVGHIPVDFSDLDADTFSFSSHKIGGPQGVGALVVRRQAHLAALQRGGTQELGRRAGTENVAGIVGFGQALKEACDELETRQKHWLALRDELEKKLNEIPGVLFNSSLPKRLPHLVNVSFQNLEGEALLIRLDMEKICLSSGSACHADDPQPSHVLMALGRSQQEASSALRFSFGPDTTFEEISICAQKVKQLVAQLTRPF